MDSDGIPDIAVGEIRGGSNTGALHIIYMNANGTIKNTVEINGTTANGPALSPLGGFGASVASLGDLDGDGTPDIAVGENRGGAGNTGALHIIYMNADGTIKNTVEINGTTANGPTLDSQDKFGISVASLGDLDGDGIPDIAVGASGDDANGDRKGTIHIMLTKDRASDISAPRIAAGPIFTYAQSSSNQQPTDKSSQKPPADKPTKKPSGPEFVNFPHHITITAGNTFTRDIDARDPDGGTLKFSLTALNNSDRRLHISNAQINPSSGLITWNTGPGDVGEYSFSVSVTAGASYTTQAFIVTVVS